MTQSLILVHLKKMKLQYQVGHLGSKNSTEEEWFVAKFSLKFWTLVQQNKKQFLKFRTQQMK
ncbi:unnamed protein product [Paramecium octaurelia]|uniref:Uncharacterized protein n=1 Tax=Paramecium octaurelia TaxID=43137 RepID=A0A8S1SPZ5_PAROT|nr:unnamed protein product [Paramecium octaurelia]